MDINKRPSISVIVPVHRSEDLLVDAVHKIYSFLTANFKDFEVILIDSGIGHAPELCDHLAKTKDGVRVIHDFIHTQFGAKLKIGYEEASKDLVWLVLLDLPFNLEYCLEAIPLLEKCDCVFSYRIEDSRGLWRRIQTRVYNLLTYWILGLRVKSVNSQFRIFKTKVVKRLKPISDGWFIDAEVLYYITKLGIPYLEIPIPIIEHKNLKSSVSTFAFLGILKEMIIFFRRKEI